MTEATKKASITKDKELEISTKYSISYIRLSTKKQTKAEPSGIERQEEEYQSLVYCRELGITIPKFVQAKRTSQVEVYRQAWLNGKLFNEYPTDGIVIKINSRKLQLIRESNKDQPLLWQYAIKYQLWNYLQVQDYQ